MEMLIVSEWWKERKDLNIQTVQVSDGQNEVAQFEIMALTPEMVEEIQCYDELLEALSKAAELGSSFYRERVCEDEELALDFSILWKHKAIKDIKAPTAKEQVGLAVCEISGLESFVDDLRFKAEEEVREKEEAAKLAEETKNAISSDDPNFDPSKVDMHELNEAMQSPNNL